MSPTITLKTTTAPTLDEGATRTLFCVASGNPKPTYRWYKDNVKILEDQNKSNYTITSVSRNDALGRTDVKLLLMFQLLASTVTLTLFRLQLDVSQLTIPTSILFPG